MCVSKCERVNVCLDKHPDSGTTLTGEIDRLAEVTTLGQPGTQSQFRTEVRHSDG